MAEDRRAELLRALPWLAAFAVVPAASSIPVFGWLVRNVGDPDIHLACDAVIAFLGAISLSLLAALALFTGLWIAAVVRKRRSEV